MKKTNEMQVFNNGEFGEVRIFENDVEKLKKEWFDVVNKDSDVI